MILKLEPAVFLACLAIFSIGAFAVLMFAIWLVALVATVVFTLAREAWDFFKPKRFAS